MTDTAPCWIYKGPLKLQMPPKLEPWLYHGNAD
jgi:hypothetical protein